MANKASPATDGAITRRTFLKLTIGLGVAAVVVPAAAGMLSGCAKPAATADLKVASSTDLQHSHNVTIPGADIDSAPAQKTYTSDGPTHTHQITLVQADFQKLKNGDTVTVTSTSTGTTPHTHTFTLKTA